MSETIKQTKYCNTCKTIKPILLFSKQSHRKDGLQTKCKECAKNHYINTKDKISIQMKEYYKINRQLILDKKLTYYQKNKVHIAQIGAKRYEREKENILYKNKQYRSNNKILIAKQKNKRYHEKRREILDKSSKYQKTIAGKMSATNAKHRRRALTKNSDLTTIQLINLRKTAKVCYWCKCNLKNVKVHIDHYDPLVKGGLHTLSNLVVSCQSCNNKKSAKDPIVFANSLGRLL